MYICRKINFVMKKLLLLFVALVNIFTIARAQLTVTPEVGVSAVKTNGMGDGWRPGVKIGAALEYQITPKLFSIESGLFYTQRGYSIIDGLYSNGGTKWIEDVSQTRHFIQLPVLAKFSWDVADETKFFLAMGPYIGLCLKNKINSDPRLVEFTDNPQPPSIGYTEFGNSNQYLYEHARNFDWGLSAATGVEVKRWVVKLQYDLSLGKESKGSAIGANYHTVTLSAGYKFKL